ncbi:MAG: hypothetical protein ACM37W_20660 [Actinomycetota bacterium]
MMPTPQDFCFCTLALQKQFRRLAQNLARDIEKYSPGTSFVILSDDPQDFRNYPNVLAFKHHQQGILKCYNDRQFVLKKALSLFPVAIHIDADTKLTDYVPDDIEWQPGITTGEFKAILNHGKNSRTPALQQMFKELAAKLGVSIEEVNHIEEGLYIITRDGGREIDFLRQWEKIGRYIEMKGSHDGDGNAMGLAVAKVGWTVKTEGWERLNQVRHHSYITSHRHSSLEANKPLSLTQKISSFWDLQKRRIGYHYRLNKARIIALKDFDFYYSSKTLP